MQMFRFDAIRAERGQTYHRIVSSWYQGIELVEKDDAG